MVGGGVVARPSEPRVSTGIRSLDEMLEGGLVAHRPYLIVGPSGTGKTTLGIQFLCEGVRRHERVLLVTLEEPPNEARVNHRGLEPDLDRVEVFDAIPDIMRYERTPFKDIASVRTAVPFAQVPFQIRKSPELASVEVTITALEQMLRTEVIRRGYSRVVVDSLTALQYFCMKGFEPIAGAQSFLRFLSDLRVTTLLTVESPLEDIETPERMLARGEIRLFRWELDGQTVRAIGVEKFRGSSHDVRLHPYRIGPLGIDVNLEVTISRDTRQIIEPLVPALRPSPPTAVAVAPLASSVTPLVDEVRDLILLGADVAPARSEIEAALTATNDGHPDQARAHLSHVTSQVMGLVDQLSRAPGTPEDPTAVAALQRVIARAESMRAGLPPTSLPPPTVLQVQLGALLSLLPPPAPAPAPTAVEAPTFAVPVPPPAAEAVEPTAPAPLEPEVVAPEPPPVPPATSVPEPEIASAGGPTEANVASVPAPSPVVESPPAAPSPPTVPAVPAEPAVAAVPVIEAVPEPPPEPEPPRRARTGRGLPPPPKPRPPVPIVRPAKPVSAPLTRAEPSRAEPPPLPTTAVPEWAAPRATSPSASAPGKAATPAPSTPRPHAASATTGAPPRPAPSPAKKRKKTGAAAPAAKKSAVHGRATASHGAPAAPVLAGTEPPLLPQPAPPIPEAQLPPTPKPRRRPARKRKAPPVVSVTVEPIPPGVFSNPDDAKRPTDSGDKSSAPEE